MVITLMTEILNSLFSNTIKNDATQVETYLNELEYLIHLKKLELPYDDNLNDWEISVERVSEMDKKLIVFEAVNNKMNKTLTRTRFEAASSR